MTTIDNNTARVWSVTYRTPTGRLKTVPAHAVGEDGARDCAVRAYGMDFDDIVKVAPEEKRA